MTTEAQGLQGLSPVPVDDSPGTTLVAVVLRPSQLLQKPLTEAASVMKS